MGKCKNEVCLLPALKRVKKGYPHGDAPSYLTISNQKKKKRKRCLIAIAEEMPKIGVPQFITQGGQGVRINLL